MNHPFSLPRYPLPDVDNPYAEELQAETTQWFQDRFQFLSAGTLEKYKRMGLDKFASRCYPRTVSYAHLRACCLFTFTATIMDDYYEPCTEEEIESLRQRVVGIFKGNEPSAKDNGILQQMVVARDALQELMPVQWMERFTEHTDWYIGKGMKAECPYVLERNFPALSDYMDIREHSIGAYVMCDLVEVATGLPLPPHIARHQAMQQLTRLASRIKAWLNDLASLPKDMSRESEVMNLVLVLQQEQQLSIDEAYAAAMRLHDTDLDEFFELQARLPDFGTYHDAVTNYLYHLMLMIQGERTWYLKDTLRYAPNGYAEPEYKRS